MLGDAERQRELQEAEGRALRQVMYCLPPLTPPPSFPGPHCVLWRP